MKIPKTIIAGCLLAGVLAMAPKAQGVAFNDVNYVGFFDPDNPSGPTNEDEYINFLIDIAAGGTDTQSYGNNKTRSYDRTDSEIASGILPDVTGNGVDISNGNSGTVNGSGYQYLLGKYGNVAYVWYDAAGFSSSESMPLNLTGGGLSHTDGFNGGGTSVPDAGATMVLFGAGLLGVGALRRRLGK